MALTIPSGTYRKWGMRVMIVPPDPPRDDKDDTETSVTAE